MKIEELKAASRDPQRELELLVDRKWLPAAIQSWNFQAHEGTTTLFNAKIMYWASLGDFIMRDPQYVDLTGPQCEVLLRLKDTSLLAELDRARAALKTAMEEIARLRNIARETDVQNRAAISALRMKVSEAIK